MVRRSPFLLPAVLAALITGCERGSASQGPPVRAVPAAEVPVSTKTVKAVRHPAVAGLFYPADRTELSQTVDGLLAKAKPEPLKGLRGLVAPHAGYAYSGPTAAMAYKQLQGREYDTVLVMAPSHYAAFEGGQVPEVDAYATPLGLVPVAGKAKPLAAAAPFAARPESRVQRPGWWRQSPKNSPPAGEDTPDTWEHSLEVQLPFLQKTLKDFALVPIVFGEIDVNAAAKRLSEELDDRTLLVASSDLSHYYPDEKARKLDRACIDAVCGLDIERMERQEACGKTPILVLMHVARQKGWKAKLLQYSNSGETGGDRSAVVGYAAIAFYDDRDTPEKGTSNRLAPESRAMLLGLARKTLTEVVQGREPARPDEASFARRLAEPAACFVTLTKNGQLRGCIGHLAPEEPLYRAVMTNAARAALSDPRFRPVQPDELSRIEIEISVLSVPKPLDYASPDDLLKKLRPGVDGVVLRRGPRQATYLPQVWEQLPEPPEFLSRLCEKAGLEASDWKRPGLVVLTYQVEAFHEGAK